MHACYSSNKVSKHVHACTHLSAQGCSGWQWVKCGGEVAKCAADCAQGITSSQCISCLGSSYDECKNCFSLMEEVLAQGVYYLSCMHVYIKVQYYVSCPKINSSLHKYNIA